jgi:hypothetical protein
MNVHVGLTKRGLIHDRYVNSPNFCYQLKADLRLWICPRAAYRLATAPSGVKACNYHQGEVSQ